MRPTPLRQLALLWAASYLLFLTIMWFIAERRGWSFFFIAVVAAAAFTLGAYRSWSRQQQQ